MNRELKIWGERWCVRKDSTHAVSYLEVKPWSRCSWHSHMQKWNRFVVVQGQIEIKTNDGVVMLSRGDSCDVKPGESHEFRTREQPCMMVEEMFVQYDESDICRVIVGGRWGPE